MSKRKKSASLTLSAEGFASLANELVASHASLLGEGYVIAPSSRIWRRNDGSWGARFIYKSQMSRRVALTIEHRVDFEESA